jgi:hypothetical protein
MEDENGAGKCLEDLSFVDVDVVGLQTLFQRVDSS